MAELRELEAKAKEVGARVGSAMPPGVGFALFLFDFGPGGWLTWVSNADRTAALQSLSEILDAEAVNTVEGDASLATLITYHRRRAQTGYRLSAEWHARAADFLERQSWLPTSG